MIPAEMRESLGITAGTRVVLRQEGSHLILEPVSEKLIDDLYGIFEGGPSMTDELIKDRRSDKW